MNLYVNDGHDCLPINLYLQKKARHQIWSVGFCLLNLGLKGSENQEKSGFYRNPIKKWLWSERM